MLASLKQRPTVALALIVIAAGCWWWIVVMARDMYGSMAGASAWMMTTRWDASHLLLLWAMWAAMMTAMMLPSATPTILLAGGNGRSYFLALGYIVAWTVFSVGATALQWLLGRTLVLNPMMEVSSRAAAAALLFTAGLYQLTPLKSACLTTCQSPMAFVTRHWRSGRGGAFRMGVEHGAYCVGCCWALMLLLFAGGVMNLTVILALTVFVAFEKMIPLGEITTRSTGVALLVLATWMLVS